MSTGHALRAAPTIVAVALAAGCRDASDVADGFAVRDSAGIAIVESETPAWAAGGGWAIAPAARFIAGLPQTDSTPASGRIWDAVFLGHGRIAMADALARRIHVLDGRGRLLASLGGKGEAPGRLVSLVRVLAYRGDSIAAYDLTRAAIEVFAADGSHGRTVQLERGRGRRPPFAVLADGRFVLWNGLGDARRRVEAERDAAAIMVASTDGSRIEPVAIDPRPAGSSVFVAAGGDAILWARADRREILRVDADGAKRVLLRWGTPTDSDAPPPSALRWAPGGQIWALRAADPPITETWDVFDREGRWLGPMRLPAGASLLDVGDSGVLVRLLADDGTDRLALHEIHPATGPILR